MGRRAPSRQCPAQGGGRGCEPRGSRRARTLPRPSRPRRPYRVHGEVEVKVEGGEATLTGTAWSREEKWRLEQLADPVLGVEDVPDGPAHRAAAGRRRGGARRAAPHAAR